MRLFGFELTRRKAAGDPVTYPPQGFVTQFHGASSSWWPVIREGFAGAWQRRITTNRKDVLGYSTVWSCVTLIAADISKMRVRLMQLGADGIWQEIQNPAYSPVLRKPNHYQTWIKFCEQWALSRLTAGNTYEIGRAHV